MTDTQAARKLAYELASTALSENAAQWALSRAHLDTLDGRGWLLLDDAARTYSYLHGTPISGVRGWSGAGAAEPTGLVAAVTSLHVDGRLRERAVRTLGQHTSSFVVPALAVRLLDHVPQVREAAWHALAPLLTAETAEPALDVILAGRQRHLASAALQQIEHTVLATAPTSALVAELDASASTRVRRWAMTLRHRESLLSPADLVDAARTDADQWIRAACADWLMAAADPEALTALLDAPSVDSRLVGLTRVPDRSLSDSALAVLLEDRASRVRAQARWRARRRGMDVAAFYRDVLARPGVSPRAVVASLEALAEVGDGIDLRTASSWLEHESARVRAAAVSAVAGRAPRGTLVDLLAPALLDPSGRVSSAAAGALARSGADLDVVEPAWRSGRVASRRAAWRLSRSPGGWDRVAADSRAACDSDTRLRGLGRTGLENWLALGAATTWGQPTSDQRGHILASLGRSDLDPERQRVLAFHAGITLPPKMAPRSSVAIADPAAAPSLELARWRRVFRRKPRRRSTR